MRGADLAWMAQQFDAGPTQRAAAARLVAQMLRALDRLPKPLIGRVQGPAFGGGLGLMSICDVAIGVQGARFGLTETRLGLIPATIGPYVVARMGAARARRVFMSSRVFDAGEAVELGLLARAVAPEALDSAVQAEVNPYLDCAPGAVNAAKALVQKLDPTVSDDIVDYTVHQLIDRWQDPEAQEGIKAYFARRKPSWQRDK